NLSRISNFSPDYELHRHYMRVQPRSLKGVVRRHPEGGARRGVPRRRLATVAPGGRGPPPGTTTRMWEFAVTDPAAMPVRGSAAPSPKIATVRAPGGGRPPYGGARRLARSWPAPIVQAQRMPRKHPYVSRRSATPSFGVAKPKCKTRAQNAPRERDGLCEIRRQNVCRWSGDHEIQCTIRTL